MPTRAIKTPASAIDFDAIRAELDIPDEYPADAHSEAEALADQAEQAWDRPVSSLPRGDDRDIPFVTVDPVGSRDLDQAVHIEAAGDGYRVRYAIADVNAFVAPGSSLDRASRERGMTLYSPDKRTPLYPTVLSEGAASLLPDQDRPAVLWTMDLDATGEPTAVTLQRTLVRSRARLDYAAVQAAANLGELHPSIALLPRVGRLREQAARRRHAINLDLPDAEVVPDGHGHWTLTRRAMLPVEEYNAQISLLTGMCAARMMLDGRIGILRTLPPPSADQERHLRRSTAVFGIDWPVGVPAGDIVSDLNSSHPAEAAFIEDAIRLLRGAGYTPFDGTLPDQDEHGGLAAPYAHVTAPLRRLVDRFATEVCLALSAGTEVPEWVRTSLPELPSLMGSAGQRASRLEHACLDAVADFLLSDRIGEVLTGIVVQADRTKDKSTVWLDEPPVRVGGPADGLTEGSRAAVRLVRGDDGAIRAEPVT